MLDSLRGVLPMARGFRALTMLFYATHLRSKGFFGAVNQRKQELIRYAAEHGIDGRGAEALGEHEFVGGVEDPFPNRRRAGHGEHHTT